MLTRLNLLDRMQSADVPSSVVEKAIVEPVQLEKSDPMDVDTSATVAPAEGHDTVKDLDMADPDDEEKDEDDEEEEEEEDPEETARRNRPSKPKDLNKDGGVIKKILRRGENWDRPEKDDEVQVNYVGRLVEEGKGEGEGEVFDSNQDRKHPFTFILGKGQVIKGWDRAVKSMKKGELARVTLKPEYAYGEAGAPPKIPPNATLEFDIELLGWKNVNALTPDGLVTLKMLKENSAGWQSPKDGWDVVVSYIAKANGVEYERVEELTFTIGSPDSTSTPYFNDAVKKFKKASSAKCGDIGLLTVPASHHTITHPGVPEGATVTFEIKILRWMEVEELEGKGAFKRTIKEAESGWEKPKDGSSVRIKFSGRTKVTGHVFASGEEELVVKLGDNSLPEAVEVALTTMKAGEKCSVSANPDWGYGAKLTKELGLEQLSAEGFEFEVELIKIEAKAKESYEMNKDEKLEESEGLKEMGNACFKDNKIRSACRKYEKALKNFQHDTNLAADEKTRINNMKLPCHLNLAQCYLKSKSYDKAIEECNKALAISPRSVKALYRRSQARLNRVELDQAKADILKAIEYDTEAGSNGAGLKAFLKQVNLEIKKYEDKDRKMYQKMFR
ncbi:hypothetical protein HDU97_003197 [Phlyctochytrium planicorne]|nr:hypothetical protein HDU97_003197 [Phlyctochytrium planicorne]